MTRSTFSTEDNSSCRRERALGLWLVFALLLGAHVACVRESVTPSAQGLLIATDGDYVAFGDAGLDVNFGTVDAGAVTTVTFEERGGKTLVVVRDLYPSKEALDAGIGSTDGMGETFDQLDALLVALDASAGRS